MDMRRVAKPEAEQQFGPAPKTTAHHGSAPVLHRAGGLLQGQKHYFTLDWIFRSGAGASLPGTIGPDIVECANCLQARSKVIINS